MFIKHCSISTCRYGSDAFRLTITDALKKYLADSLNAIFLEAGKDKGFVYGCYIAANADIAKADNTFRALHFERIDVTDAYIGTPKEACEKLDQDIEAVQKKILTQMRIRLQHL